MSKNFTGGVFKVDVTPYRGNIDNILFGSVDAPGLSEEVSVNYFTIDLSFGGGRADLAVDPEQELMQIEKIDI